MGGEEEGRGFKIQDRRRFSPETGEPRDESVDSAQRENASSRPAGSVEAPPSERATSSEINFSTFVISISTQALMHLGEIPNPVDGKVEKDVLVAKQMIDIMNVLREKTQGNLDQAEQKLLEDALYDVRMRYVEVVKKG